MRSAGLQSMRNGLPPPELTMRIYLAAAAFIAEFANSDSFWSLCFSSSSVVRSSSFAITQQFSISTRSSIASHFIMLNALRCRNQSRIFYY